MPEVIATKSIKNLSIYLTHQFGVKPIVLLDEYDTPMQEAWISGYWDEAVRFFQ